MSSGRTRLRRRVPTCGGTRSASAWPPGTRCRTPTNHLDVRHQFDALGLPRALDVTAVVALHDLNLSAHYCDEIHVLQHGRQIRSGPPEHVLTPDLLRSVYGVPATVTPHAGTGRPHIAFHPR